MTVLLGRDEAGLAAVVRVYDAHDGDFVLDVIAVAVRHRDTGGLVADEAFARTTEWCATQALQNRRRRFRLVTFIDERNSASQRLARRDGMIETPVAKQNRHATWAGVFDL